VGRGKKDGGSYGEEGCDVEAEEGVGAVEEGAEAGGEGRARWPGDGVSLCLIWGCGDGREGVGGTFGGLGRLRGRGFLGWIFCVGFSGELAGWGWGGLGLLVVGCWRLWL